MKMKTLATLLIFISSLVISQNVSIKNAQIVATNFYTNKVEKLTKTDNITVKFKKTTIIKNKNNEPVLYIFELKNNGYIITSTNINITPILAYSNQSNFNIKTIPPSVNFWLNRYKEQTEHIAKNNIKSTTNTNLWNKWLTNTITQKDISEILVEPLITSEWNQGVYYNAMCPTDALGPDGHCVTGCVATATAQLLYYHRFPTSGTGSYSYNCPNYGTISENFSTATYNYNEMADKLTNYSYSAALLTYHLGVTFDMFYGPEGSGVWNHSVANSLKTYFKYCAETEYVFRDSTSLNWDSLVLANLIAKKPIYYGGWEDSSYTSGHAFICDGYQGENYYHFNWGWGGYSDGWFYTNNLTPGVAQFTYCQELIKDLYPDTINYSYPEYCSENDTLTNSFASVTDGSASKNYANNANCTWYINPTCGQLVDVKFDEFNVKQNDTLFVYNGNNENSELFSYYTQGTEPILSNFSNSTLFTSTNGNVFVKFTSDNDSTDNGWKLSYTSKYCIYGLNITDTTGTITDGSEDCNYKPSQNCKWTIEPTNAEAILLTFTQFELDTSNTNDYVRIYKNTTQTSDLIAEFKSNSMPTEIYVPSGIAIVKFYSSINSNNGKGWLLDYHKTTINDVKMNNLTTKNVIYPNPINNNSVLEFSSKTADKGTFYITDVNGKNLLEQNININSGLNQINISDFCSINNKGIYFLKIVANNFTFSNKIIVN